MELRTLLVIRARHGTRIPSGTVCGNLCVEKSPSVNAPGSEWSTHDVAGIIFVQKAIQLCQLNCGLVSEKESREKRTTPISPPGMRRQS